jgi:hypothetical protein
MAIADAKIGRWMKKPTTGITTSHRMGAARRPRDHRK